MLGKNSSVDNYIIEKIRIDWGEIPVHLTFSYGNVNRFPFLIARIYTRDFHGIGEVLVPPNDFINAFLPSLIGCDARGLDTLLPVTEKDLDRMLCESISIALYDLVGRIFGLPVNVLLGGKKNTCVPLMPCIFPDNPDEAEKKAEYFFSCGYGYLKTKLSGNLNEDIRRIKSIRRVLPKKIILQGDANEGYKSISSARKAVEELGKTGLDIFEDPLQGGVEEYYNLRKELNGRGAKVMVDELARRTSDLVAVLKIGAADVISIHPDQPGSLSRALHYARLAQTFSVPVAIGGTGYTGIGTAAYQHLTAVATPDGPCGELGGFFDHGMPCSLVKQPLPVKDGYVILPDTPGIGVELDENALAKFATGKKEWSFS
jgi:L-alanine-DL-glutamate epimerase-like enolase superfamily enzyme